MENTEEHAVTLEELQRMEEENRAYIDRAESLEKLLKNKDFKKLFTDYYCKDYATRIVGLLGDPSLNLGGSKEIEREEIMESLIGVARFQVFLRSTRALAEQAKANLEQIKTAENDYYEKDNINLL